MNSMRFAPLPEGTLHQGALFSTAIGWAGLLTCEGMPVRLSIGNENREAALRTLKRFAPRLEIPEVEPLPELVESIERFCAGVPVDFTDYSLWIAPTTSFRQRVLEAARAIPHGETVSYKQLAELVGSPRAARAIGNVMASNPLPILIPCHRVIGSDGKLHGFSAPRGTDLKQVLLDLEEAALVGGPA
jgi:methylated-DNA-[protein]-cysteine S-methyltransferase